jgi:hypothetical protein
MVAIKDKGVCNHIYLKNLNKHHVKGQLGNGQGTINGAIPKRTGGIYFTVLDEATGVNSRFNDVLIDGCAINYCEKLEMDIEDYLYNHDDEYVELEIDKITYLLSLRTCLQESVLDYKIYSKLKYPTINIKVESLI